jgi:hypothetical protein
MRKSRSPRPFSSTRKPIPRTLDPKRLNRQASKHLLRHPLGRSPNPTNSDFLVALKAGSGQSPPKQSYRAPPENAATKCFQEP